jgi:hypothetical protein
MSSLTESSQEGPEKEESLTAKAVSMHCFSETFVIVIRPLPELVEESPLSDVFSLIDATSNAFAGTVGWPNIPHAVKTIPAPMSTRVIEILPAIEHTMYGRLRAETFSLKLHTGMVTPAHGTDVS